MYTRYEASHSGLGENAKANSNSKSVFENVFENVFVLSVGLLEDAFSSSFFSNVLTSFSISPSNSFCCN